MTDSNERSEPDFAAFIGIDWADQRHAWALQTTTQKAIESGNIDHTPEAIDLGHGTGAPISGTSDRDRAGAVAWRVAVYAHQVRSFRAVSHSTHHPRQLSQRVSALGSQK